MAAFSSPLRLCHRSSAVSNRVMAEPAAKRIANRVRNEMGRGPTNRMRRCYG